MCDTTYVLCYWLLHMHFCRGYLCDMISLTHLIGTTRWCVVKNQTLLSEPKIICTHSVFNVCVTSSIRSNTWKWCSIYVFSDWLRLVPMPDHLRQKGSRLDKHKCISRLVKRKEKNTLRRFVNFPAHQIMHLYNNVSLDSWCLETYQWSCRVTNVFFNRYWHHVSFSYKRMKWFWINRLSRCIEVFSWEWNILTIPLRNVCLRSWNKTWVSPTRLNLRWESSYHLRSTWFACLEDILTKRQFEYIWSSLRKLVIWTWASYTDPNHIGKVWSIKDDGKTYLIL